MSMSKLNYYFWEAIYLIAFLLGGVFTLGAFWALGVMLHLWSW
jgi:hypothetical protein